MADPRRYPREMPADLEPWRPTLEVWHRAIELGALEGERLELLDGAVVAMNPIDASHENAVRFLANLAFSVTLADRTLQTGIASPLTLAEGWEPQPDLSIFRPDAPRLWHPSTALWACEVANSSLTKDRTLKSVGYAAAGIPEYWVVALGHQHVEVLTEPTPEAGYAVTTVVRAGTLRSSSLPALAVDLDALWGAVLGA